MKIYIILAIIFLSWYPLAAQTNVSCSESIYVSKIVMGAVLEGKTYDEIKTACIKSMFPENTKNKCIMMIDLSKEYPYMIDDSYTLKNFVNDITNDCINNNN